MSFVVGLSVVVSALATVGIFLFTRLNLMIYKELQKKQEEQQQKFNDLLEAIVVATIVSTPNIGVKKDIKRNFLREYKGKAKIFKENELK